MASAEDHENAKREYEKSRDQVKEWEELTHKDREQLAIELKKAGTDIHKALRQAGVDTQREVSNLQNQASKEFNNVKKKLGW